MSHSPVLIIGAGPVGQLSALLLARHGIASRLIDRRPEVSTAPKAHAVNPRTLEICESAGVDAAALREAGAEANDGGFVRFVGTLTGPEFGALPYERMDDGAFEHTPYPLINLPQPVFEAALQEAIDAEPLIEFARGVECTGLEQDADGVVARLTDHATGAASDHSSDYVIAADGAGSRTREALGIGMEGPESLQHYIMIHFEADLRALTDARPGVLYFLFDPATSGVMIAYDRAKTWVLMHAYDPGAESADAYDDARCLALVGTAIGAEVNDIAVRNISPWAMSAQIAERYREGRVFLAGDAAHRFPPTGGLGLNTGAGDAQNIAWKLAAVLKGDAGPRLLDSYEAERRPIAAINSEQSLINASKIFELFGVLHGPDPAAVAAHYAKAAADPAGVPGIGDVIEAQRPHFDSFNLQIGYRYVSDVVAGAAPLPAAAEIETSNYVPSWEAGARVPHRWITRDGARVSLLNMLPPDGFSLVSGPKANGAFRAAELGMPQFALGRDFEDAGLDWEKATGLPETGIVLVRPDGHIAARFTGTERDPGASLDGMLRALTARV